VDKKARAQGCLLGGAVGDALGYQVEFLSYPDILSRFSAQGVTDLPNPAFISDDTQMTLFTAEGLLECQHSSDIVPSVYHSYLRWLKTQNGTTFDNVNYAGGLMDIPALYKSRAPGTTCLSALSSGQCGRIDHPINNSKGCGGVMRVAPCAFFDDSFQLGCDVAAITHTHPSGYLSAGVLAQLLHELLEGSNIDNAINKLLSVLSNYPGNEETIVAIKKAISLAKQGNPYATKVEMLGGGWVGEEALAIAIYCTLCYPDNFEMAVCLAVNHSGDSDSTGAICGNIMGMMLGIDAIPEKWRSDVELSEIIMGYADQFVVQ
jgi:ADP-ribosylglycohydrolase